MDKENNDQTVNLKDMKTFQVDSSCGATKIVIAEDIAKACEIFRKTNNCYPTDIEQIYSEIYIQGVYEPESDIPF